MNASELFLLLADNTSNTLKPGTSPNFSKVHLYTNNYSPLPQSTLPDFTEATYTGYAAVDLPAWGDPSTVSPQEVQVLGVSTLQFPGPTSGPPATIYGYYWVDSAGNLIGAERFSTPIPLSSVTDVITLLPGFTYKAPVDVSFVLS